MPYHTAFWGGLTDACIFGFWLCVYFIVFLVVTFVLFVLVDGLDGTLTVEIKLNVGANALVLSTIFGLLLFEG